MLQAVSMAGYLEAQPSDMFPLDAIEAAGRAGWQRRSSCGDGGVWERSEESREAAEVGR